ncbi:MAG TPA: hypothetical protein VEU72_09595 [Nitrosopumilaceae archaeon]|nr:hypothetical protein [Nitrosopumilaceae archaeon]
MKDRYNKNRLKIQLEKRERTKKKRLEYIELLGGMCAGCGERFNKHARISNLQFDHKQYFTGKTMPKSVLYQMDDLRKNGVDLNPYFILLCIDCHRIMTAVRKHRDKTMKMFDYISKNNMF